MKMTTAPALSGPTFPEPDVAVIMPDPLILSQNEVKERWELLSRPFYGTVLIHVQPRVESPGGKLQGHPAPAIVATLLGQEL